MASTDRLKDLPLTANVDDVMARHYMIRLQLKEHLHTKTWIGQLLLVLEPVGEGMSQFSLEHNYAADLGDGKCFRCVLDCCDIDVATVEEVDCDSDDISDLLNWRSERRFQRETMLMWFSRPRKTLQFEVTEWSLEIWKPGFFSKTGFPRALCISYFTMEKGKSLTWALDQANRPCVFTQGASVNNRSLFPCQEPPIAMATWQVQVVVPEELLVLTSGDEDAVITQDGNGFHSFYYYTKMVLPMATLALAVGSWECKTVVSRQFIAEKSHLQETNTFKGPCLHDDYPCYLQSEYHHPLIPCRVFGVYHLLEKFVEEFGEYIPHCLEAAFRVLGPHPFSRLDILIVPKCFASLGFASPNLLLVSQSMLTGDGSMSVRLAHEVSHSWFGLSIGARDWTEEWLSEGFATFTEDTIHAVAMKWSDQCRQEQAELRSLVRHQILSAELDNSDVDLQMLRPNKGQGDAKENSVSYVKNGMNPYKSFTQVHYLKGYFLLRHLSHSSGDECFMPLLRHYVTQFHGQLVLSQEIFALFFDKFPNLRYMEETIYRDWLDFPGMPSDLIHYTLSQANLLYTTTLQELEKWKSVNRTCFKYRRNKRSKVSCCLEVDYVPLEACQLVLLLELLLGETKLNVRTLEALRTTYNLDHQNADVRHRWCELIVKHKYVACEDVLQQFLLEDQAMGVYLYGELILSQNTRLRNLAETCFREVKSSMDWSCLQTVQEMLGDDLACGGVT